MLFSLHLHLHELVLDFSLVVEALSVEPTAVKPAVNEFLVYKLNESFHKDLKHMK